MSAVESSIENVGYILMGIERRDQDEQLVALICETSNGASAYTYLVGKCTLQVENRAAFVSSQSAAGIQQHWKYFSEGNRIRPQCCSKDAGVRPEDVHARKLTVLKTARPVSLQSACDAVVLEGILQQHLRANRSGWEPQTLEKALDPSFQAIFDFNVNAGDYSRADQSNAPLRREFVAMRRDSMGRESYIMDDKKRADMEQVKRTPGIADATGYMTAADALRAVSQFGTTHPGDTFFVVRADYFHGAEPLSREQLQDEALNQAVVRLSPESAAVVRRLRDNPLTL